MKCLKCYWMTHNPNYEKLHCDDCIHPNIVNDITEGLVGHIAIDSITHYVVNHINETYNTQFENTNEMVEFAQANDGEVFECDDCGWYDDYLYFCDDCQMSICDDCKYYDHDHEENE